MPLFSKNKLNCFFYHIPKTGGTSLEESMKEIGVNVSLWSTRLHLPNKAGFPCSPQHWHASIIKEILDDFYLENSFAIVRNPIDRLVSEYRHRVKSHLKRNKYQDIPSFNFWATEVFDEYQKNPYILDNHIRPQSDFIDKEAKVFYLEENGVDFSFQFVIDKLRVEEAKGFQLHLNKSAEVNVTIDDKVLGKILRFYEKDFTRFSYSEKNANFL